MPQCSGYTRFELQINNNPHGLEDIVYGNGLFFKVQNCPDIMQGLLANDQVAQRCRSSCFVFYCVRDQVN
jgi:hypothetical protein